MREWGILCAMNLSRIIAQETGIASKQIAAVISLLDEGNTIPFVARYRKEASGGLDEVQLRLIEKQLTVQRSMQARRETVLATIDQQGKLTDALRAQIQAASTRTALEDLYQPYKPRRRTRAQAARERGLAPLAALLLEQPLHAAPPDELARPFLKEGVANVDAAWKGAVDIVAEGISDHPGVRSAVRQKASQWGLLRSRKKKNAEDARGVYRTYWESEFRVDRLRPHQVLAINRGEREGVLSVSIDIAERDWRPVLERAYPSKRDSVLASLLARARDEAADRLLLPAIVRDVRRVLTEQAEAHAIKVFAENLTGLLRQPPLHGIVLGIDPGYRTGSKLAVIDETGRLLETATIYPHPPQSKHEASCAAILHMIERWAVTLIAIGNGTASRETEQLVAGMIRDLPDVHYVIVSEAGASVYSASPLAAREFPDLDVSLRGAVSIARRIQDPLAELVKIDPRSIGVGMYQHDVNQNELACALHDVVESVVNAVGVDVNTASSSLLAYVAGIGPQLAEKIVAHREKHGAYQSRRALLKVKGLGAKGFEQAAGFLRIRDGREPLDTTAIHPESYPATRALLERSGVQMDMALPERERRLNALLASVSIDRLATELGVGEATLEDICEQLIRPGLDPREEAPAPILRRDVLAMEDLKPGMRLKGTVRNVVDFGAFVDVGVKQDGLLHRSQWQTGEQFTVGEILEVTVLEIDMERKRISLGRGLSSAG